MGDLGFVRTCKTQLGTIEQGEVRRDLRFVRTRKLSWGQKSREELRNLVFLRTCKTPLGNMELEGGEGSGFLENP